jgi:hypothetical protein
MVFCKRDDFLTSNLMVLQIIEHLISKAAGLAAMLLRYFSSTGVRVGIGLASIRRPCRFVTSAFPFKK